MPEPYYGIDFEAPIYFINRYYSSRLTIASDHVARVLDFKENGYTEEFNFTERITSTGGRVLVHLFGLENGEISDSNSLENYRDQRIKCSDSSITAINFLNIGEKIVAGDKDGHIYVIDYRTKALLHKMNVLDGPITVIEQVGSNLIMGSNTSSGLAVMDNQSFTLEYVDTQEPVQTIRTGYRGEFFYTGDVKGTLIKWSHPGLQREAIIKTDNSPITGLEVIFDNPYVITGHGNGKIKIINLKDNSLIATAKPYESDVLLAYYLYNNTFESASTRGDLHFWRLNEIEPEPYEPEDSVQTIALNEYNDFEDLFGEPPHDESREEEDFIGSLFGEEEEEPEIPEYLIKPLEIIKKLDSSNTLITSIESARSEDQPLLVGTTLLNIANIQFDKESQAVDDAFEQAAIIFEKLELFKSLGDVYHLQGMKSRFLDDEAAYTYFGKAGECFRYENAEKELAKALNTHADMSNELGYTDLALEEFTETAALAERQGLKEILAESLHELGKINRGIDTGKAKSFLDRAYEESIGLSDTEMAGRILIDLAQFEFNQKNYEKTIQNYEKAGKIFIEQGDNYYTGMCFLGIGYAHLQMDRNVDAELSLRKAIEYQYASENQYLLAKAYEGLAVVLNRLGNRGEALEMLEKSKELKEERPF